MRHDTKRSASVARAAEVWGEAALHIRHKLRSQGVRGTLPGLDDIVVGRRGRSVARGIALMVHDLLAAGTAAPETEAEVRDALHRMVQALAMDGPQRAA